MNLTKKKHDNLADKSLSDLVELYNELGINKQIDSEKFYLYSIITHSTAIEGSTVTEVENQLLFDESITVSGKTITEQLMNLDLKTAYEYGYKFADNHTDYSIENLKTLSSLVMARTGGEYQTALGKFSASKGDLRLINVTAGFGGKSYLNYSKIPTKLELFCEELNKKRHNLNKKDIKGIYKLSFWAHYELVNIHPWADGNGRTCRLIMNMIQHEFGVIPMKVLKEHKAVYIQSLVDSNEKGDINIFYNAMEEMHASNLRNEITNYLNTVSNAEILTGKIGDKSAINSKIGDKKQAIINYIKKKGFAKTAEISDLLKLSPSRTRDYLKELVDEGYLIALGANKNRKYKLKK